MESEHNYRIPVNLRLNVVGLPLPGEECTMTPGLAGFVVSGADTQTWDEVIAEVAAALGQGFAVVPERGGGHAGARRRTWLDTFDWRLYRAGLILEYAAAHRGGELRLTSARPGAPGAPSAPAVPAVPAAPAALSPGAAAGTTAPPATAGATAPPATAGAAAQPVTGWRVASPHLLGDLPDGPVTARIAGLVAPRALLPAVTVASTATVSRLLNDDGKTVARLLIECPAVANGQHAALPPRLTITEVRGYPGQARRAARIISGTAGVLPAAEPVFTDALRALGRRPGDYSSKVNANITAAMPAAKAVATIMLRLLDTIEVNLPGVLRDTDTEFLHDLRVSVRRTRSALKLFGDVLTVPAGGKARGTGLTEDELARFAAEFKWVGDLTTPTRDLDVHLLGFEDTARALRAAKPDDLEPFRAYLEQRRIKEFRALARGLRSARFTKLTREWRAALTKVADSSGKIGR